MPLSRAVLERQLKLAESTVAARAKVLEGMGKSKDALDRDPQWRSAQATCTSIRRRLAAVAATESINAEVTRRKTEPKPEPEPKPEKAEKAKAKPEKSKSEAAPKAEAGEKKPKKAKNEKAEK